MKIIKLQHNDKKTKKTTPDLLFTKSEEVAEEIPVVRFLASDEFEEPPSFLLKAADRPLFSMTMDILF